MIQLGERMYKSKRLNELKNEVQNIKDNEKKKYVKDVIEAAEWYFSCDWLEDLDNFNGFFESCQPALDCLIGDDNVDRACECAELYIEHFGPYYKNREGMELQLIYVGIIDCILTMVFDYILD